jgi:hypothetical protein
VSLEGRRQRIRAAASGSVIQAGHGDKEYAMGMVPILGARAHQVRWLACVAPDRWPVPVEPVAEFAMVSKAMAWVRADAAPHGFRAWDRLERIGLLAGTGSRPDRPHRSVGPRLPAAPPGRPGCSWPWLPDRRHLQGTEQP